MKKHLAFYTGVSVSTAMVADCLHRIENLVATSIRTCP